MVSNVAPTWDKRFKKVVILGGGEIGLKLAERLAGGNDADHIVVWNREEELKAVPAATEETKPKDTRSAEEKAREKIEAKEKRRIAAIQGIEQAQIIDGLKAPHHYADGKGRPTLEYVHDIETALAGADLVIVTSGAPRKPGQKRVDLIEPNSKIIGSLAEAAGKYAPHAAHIMVTNPVDAMAEYYQIKSGLPETRVIGLSGELDRARLIQSVAKHLGVNPGDVLNANVIGQHSDQEMVALLDNIKIRTGGAADYSAKNEMPLDQYIETRMSDESAAEGKRKILDGVRSQIEAETKGGGKYFVDMTGVSDSIGPAAALHKMAIDILAARNHDLQPLPTVCSSFGEDGVYRGRPVTFNADGSYESGRNLIPVSPADKAKLEKSIKQCRTEVRMLPGMEEGRPQLSATR